MVRTPEEYFAAQPFDMNVSDASQETLTETEKAFVQKYMGAEALEKLPVVSPESEVLPGGNGRESGPPEGKTREDKPQEAVSLKKVLQSQPRVQLVSFFVRDQKFLLPVAGIQEVLRHMPLIRLPRAPRFIAGVINLRGRVTPLIHLDALLTTTEVYRYTPQSFIIVCATNEMQMGFITDKIETMLFVDQETIIWNAEVQLGANAELLCGIVDIKNQVCGILDPEKITQHLLTAQ